MATTATSEPTTAALEASADRRRHRRGGWQNPSLPEASSRRENVRARPRKGQTRQKMLRPTAAMPSRPRPREMVAAPAAERRGPRGRQRSAGGGRAGRIRGCARGIAVASAPASEKLQDPGSDQAAPGDPGAGRQGGARQQGCCAHNLSVAGRPLHRAHAEYGARRRHQPQDHQPAGQEAPQGDRGRARGAGGHGAHHPHGGRGAHEAGDQARLRVPAAGSGRACAISRCNRRRRASSTRKAT